jgi:ubiquinone/menaquinone biosynthesis C-methylase UbiE
MTVERRVADYDRIADRFDTRYEQYPYDGIRETLLGFLGSPPSSVLEVGCGTGHWLAVAHEARLKPSPYETASDRSAKALAERAILVGLDPSAPMLDRAGITAPSAHLVRARAEDLPWRDATFDRLFCINALHHFADRARFFAEARRVLRPGGGLLTIGKDPHTDRDQWWVYEYFEETRAIDRERFARVRTLRGEMALAGFAWTESMEAEHIEVVRPATEALANGIVDAGFTSQLTVLSDEEFRRGADRLREANEQAGGELQLVADFRLYATVGWVQSAM